jgi:hypothetical protein
MRGLKILTIGMAVLIVAGVVVLGVTIARRLGTPLPGMAATVLLDEPPGTRIAGIAAVQDRLAVQLQGGGPDRVLLLDAKSGAVQGRIGLAR